MNRQSLRTLGAVTGLGWTGSLLGYIGAVAGFGRDLIVGLVTEPHVLLYTSLALLAVTLGLDKLAASRWVRSGPSPVSRRRDDGSTKHR